MEKRKIDVLIRDTMTQEAEQLHAPSDLSWKVMREICIKEKEQQNMRKTGKKRVVVLAAVFCMLSAFVAIGAGKVAGTFVGHNVNDPDFTAYSQVKEADATLGYETKHVEQFSTGYQFTDGYISTVQTIDEHGNEVGSYKDLMLNYESQKKERATLSAYRPLSTAADEIREPKASRQLGEVTLRYYSDQYLFVPPEYELTAEDRANQQRDDFFISYGSDEVEKSVVQSVVWTDNGVEYILQVMDSSLTSKQLLNMAQEVVESRYLSFRKLQ